MLNHEITYHSLANTQSLKKNAILFWTGVFFICLAACYIQNTLLISWDNSSLLHETQRLLSGGTYVNNFFETSPPMIMYLYIPPVLLAKALSLPIIPLFRAYILLLALFTLWLCRSLGKHIFLKQDAIASNIFFLTLAFVFLVMPFYEYGQREHLYFIFSMPYVLAVSIRLDKKALNSNTAILIGFIAGLGFSIKPYFLFTPLLLELYLAFARKNIAICFRAETVTIFLVMLIYTIVALCLHPDYFHVLVPFAIRLYYNSVPGWSVTLKHGFTIFSCTAILLYLLQYHLFSFYKTFTTVLCVTLISFIVLFVLQRYIFYYHALPAVGLALLMDVFLFYVMISRPITNKQLVGLTLLAAINIGLLFYFQPTFWLTLLFAPQFFWGFFISVLLVMFCVADNKNWIRFLISLGIIVSVAYWFAYLSNVVSNPLDDLIGIHHFAETILLLLIMFPFSMQKARINKLRVLVVTTTLASIMIYPAFNAYRMYRHGLNFRNHTLPLIAYMKTHMQHQSMYLFASDCTIIYPAVDYADILPATRFPYFWMLPGLLTLQKEKPGAVGFQKYIRDKKMLIDMVSEDLNTQKPDYVFIDISANKPAIKVKPFEYLTYFAENNQFQQAWKSYRYISTYHLGDPGAVIAYDFAIYQRIS